MNYFFQNNFQLNNKNYDSFTRLNQDYKNAMNLFENKAKLPDGSSIYGIVLNSFGSTGFGFGYSSGNSYNIKLNNINIYNLQISTREIIGYYDKYQVPLRGPFRDLIDMYTICHHYNSMNPLLNYNDYMNNNKSYEWYNKSNCLYKGKFWFNLSQNFLFLFLTNLLELWKSELNLGREGCKQKGKC